MEWSQEFSIPILSPFFRSMQNIQAPKEKPSLKEILKATPFVLRFLLQADKKSFWIIIITGIFRAPVATLSIIGIKNLTDAIVALEQQEIFFWFFILVSSLTFGAFTDYLSEKYRDLFRYHVDLFVQEKTMVQLTAFSFAILEDPNFQALFSAYRNKLHILLNVSNFFTRLFEDFFTFFGLLIIFVYIPWQAAVFISLALLIRFYFLKRAASFGWQVLTRETREGRRGQYFSNILLFPQSVFSAKTLGLPFVFLKEWKKISTSILSFRKKQTNASAVSVVLSSLCEVVGLAVGLWIIIMQVQVGILSISIVVVFLTTYRELESLLASISWKVKFFIDEGTYFPIFKQFFSLKLEKDIGKQLPKVSLFIEFKNVWFRYPGTKTDILKGINLSFYEGDHLGIVGLNGAGKTTLIKLLMGVYEPTKGQILINGVSLSKIKPSFWRKTLAILSQQTTEFDDTLRQQVLYGNLEKKADEKRLKIALKTSGLEEVVKELPKGIETHAGKLYAMPEDEPIELSGGQKQILGIARTLYRSARIYIFDEPTSSVDAEREEAFFDCLPGTLQGKTLIFVSHRFSTLRRAKRILVIDNGKIIEDGSHEDLMVVKGRYAELFSLQAKMYQ